MRQAGWTVEVVEREDLAPIRARHGIPDSLPPVTRRWSAPTPSRAMFRPGTSILLAERPAARALSAPGMPGMPAGSPGMEAARREPYSTVLIVNDGSTRVFGRHNGA